MNCITFFKGDSSPCSSSCSNFCAFLPPRSLPSLLLANTAHSARPAPPGSLPWSLLASGLPSSHSAFCSSCMRHKCHVTPPKYAGKWLISPGSLRHLQSKHSVPGPLNRSGCLHSRHLGTLKPSSPQSPSTGFHRRLSHSTSLTLFFMLSSLISWFCPQTPSTLSCLALTTGLPMLWSSSSGCSDVWVISKATFLLALKPFTNHLHKVRGG